MTDLDADLDEQLRQFGEELDRRSHARDTPQTAAPSVPRRGVLAGAVAVIAIGVGGLVALGALRDSSQPAPQAETSNSTAPPQAQHEPATAEAVTACAGQLSAFIDSDIPADVAAAVEWPNVDSATVLSFDVPADETMVRILIVDDNAGYTCKVHRDVTATATVDGQIIDDRLGPLPGVPADGNIRLTGSTGTSIQLGTGPGTTLYVGRVGDGVVDVSAVLPNGEPQAGAITEDWFVIDVDVPDGVELFYSDRILWTLSDGTERVAGIDQIDEVTDAEQCAAAPGCVRQRIEELFATAPVDSAQRATLRDGLVTEDERESHQRDFVECLAQAGVEATITPNGRGHVITANDDGPTETLDAQHKCGQLHLDLVAEAYDLLNAQASTDQR